MGRLVPRNPGHVQTRLEKRMEQIDIILYTVCGIIGVSLCVGWGIILPRFLARVLGFELPE